MNNNHQPSQLIIGFHVLIPRQSFVSGQAYEMTRIRQ